MISTALDDFNPIDDTTEKKEDEDIDYSAKKVIGAISTAPGMDYTWVVNTPIISTE